MESVLQFQNPWGALALLLLAPLVILYLLRQRYQEVEVPSTLLWSQVLARWEATHPWQKWRKNLLFLLQMLAVCLLALALMRPVWRTVGAGRGNIIVLDVSLSMQAYEDGSTRLERALSGARGLVEGMQPGERTSLLLAGERTEILLSRSQDKTALLRLLDEIQAQNGAGRLEEALQMAGSLLDSDDNEGIHVFTDRDIPVYNNVTTVHNLALGADNVAVTGGSYSRGSADRRLNVLGLLQNFGAAKTVQVELWGDGSLLDVRSVALAADSPGNVLFQGLDAEITRFTLALTEEDALPADNRAYLVVQDSAAYRVLLQTERNVFLERAILLRDDIELYKTTPSEGPPDAEYALLIGDGWQGEALPADQPVWVINPQADTAWYALEAAEPGEVRAAGTERGEALLRYVDLSALQLAGASTFRLQDPETAVLAYLDDRPLMILREEDGVRRLACGFDFHESNLPLQKDFPILVQNILEWFLPARQGGVDAVLAGDAVPLALGSECAHYTVRLPDGTSLERLEQPLFEQTQQLGFYTLTQYDGDGGEIASSGFAVNAAVQGESELRTAGDADGDSPAADRWSRQNLLPYAILLALLLMALEWWVYHRGA